MSCLLFYGPGAQEAALEMSERIGRPLANPYGEEGLKVDEAREIVHLMAAPPIGSGIGVIVVGPMDNATAEAQDALLKTLEEFDASQVQPILWAHDLGVVFATIRSRSHAEWCPFGPGGPEIEYRAEGEMLTKAALTRDYPTIISTLNDKERKVGNRDLLIAVVGVLADKLREATNEKVVEVLLALWEGIREVLAQRGEPSNREALAALLLARKLR